MWFKSNSSRKHGGGRARLQPPSGYFEFRSKLRQSASLCHSVAYFDAPTRSQDSQVISHCNHAKHKYTAKTSSISYIFPLRESRVSKFCHAADIKLLSVAHSTPTSSVMLDSNTVYELFLNTLLSTLLQFTRAVCSNSRLSPLTHQGRSFLHRC